MSVESFLDGRVTLHGGDCLDVLKTLADASVDTVVTDPPYHLTSIVKRFGGKGAAPAKAGQTGAYARASRGFMGKTWDGGDIAFRVELWAEVLRVLKPGGHLVAFGGTRGHHRMWSAIEDAGFDIRDTLLDLFDLDPLAKAFVESLDEWQRQTFLYLLDQSGFGGMLAWAYGTGFPKSHDVSKAIDKMAGAEREVISEWHKPGRGKRSEEQKYGLTSDHGTITAPATDAARQWQGWGSALKPAWEPICLARKPLDGSIAANVLVHGVGGLNIHGCRVPFAGNAGERESKGKNQHGDFASGPMTNTVYGRFAKDRENYDPTGRFPANIVHDGSAAVLAAFPEAGGGAAGGQSGKSSIGGQNVYGGGWSDGAGRGARATNDKGGSAARFFFSAKADAEDRLGSSHATVKPVDLIQWLIRLVTPKGGLVLDPFAGSGTCGEAAFREGCRAVLIELEAAHRVDIARRMNLALAGPATRRLTAAAAKSPTPDLGPLFSAPPVSSSQGSSLAGATEAAE